MAASEKPETDWIVTSFRRESWVIKAEGATSQPSRHPGEQHLEKDESSITRLSVSSSRKDVGRPAGTAPPYVSCRDR